MKIWTKIICLWTITDLVKVNWLEVPVIEYEWVYELDLELNEEWFNNYANRMKNIKSVDDLLKGEE